jgi:hypothetical protein
LGDDDDVLMQLGEKGEIFKKSSGKKKIISSPHYEKVRCEMIFFF